MKIQKIDGEYIKLDKFLKLVGVAQTGGQAKIMILNSQVKVNGDVCCVRGKKLHNDDVVSWFESETEIEMKIEVVDKTQEVKG